MTPTRWLVFAATFALGLPALAQPAWRPTRDWQRLTSELPGHPRLIVESDGTFRLDPPRSEMDAGRLTRTELAQLDGCFDRVELDRLPATLTVPRLSHAPRLAGVQITTLRPNGVNQYADVMRSIATSAAQAGEVPRHVSPLMMSLYHIHQRLLTAERPYERLQLAMRRYFGARWELDLLADGSVTLRSAGRTVTGRATPEERREVDAAFLEAQERAIYLYIDLPWRGPMNTRDEGDMDLGKRPWFPTRRDALLTLTQDPPGGDPTRITMRFGLGRDPLDAVDAGGDDLLPKPAHPVQWEDELAQLSQLTAALQAIKARLERENPASPRAGLSQVLPRAPGW